MHINKNSNHFDKHYKIPCLVDLSIECNIVGKNVLRKPNIREG